MFSSDNDEKELKNVEEYLKAAKGQPIVREERRKGRLSGALAKLLPVMTLIIGIVILAVAALAISLLTRVNTIESDVAAVKSEINNPEVARLRSQVGAIEAKLKELNKADEQLREDLTRVKKELDALKSQKIKAQTPSQKTAPGKKPQPASKKPRA